jgi:hypothetical protein
MRSRVIAEMFLRKTSVYYAYVSYASVSYASVSYASSFTYFIPSSLQTFISSLLAALCVLYWLIFL